MMYVLSLIVAVACIHASLAAWCWRPGVQCWGHDIGQETGTVTYCRYKCIFSYPTCKSYHRKNNICYLKDHVCKNVELRPSVGGHDYFKQDGPCDTEVVKPWLFTRYCLLPGKNCVGFGIAHAFPVPVFVCQRLCDFQPTCRSIVTSNGHCWLKFHVCKESALQSSGNSHVYIKTDNYGQACGDPEGSAGVHYCRREGFGCHGHDIAIIPGPTTTTACYNACNLNPNCKSMRIKNNGADGCQLKNHVCENHELRQQPYADDVVKHNGACDEYDRPRNKYCLRAGKDCTNSPPGWGHDIVFVSVSSSSDCQRYCDFQRDCKSIRSSGSYCWLKRHHCPDTQLISAWGGNYYYKVGIDEDC